MATRLSSPNGLLAVGEVRQLPNGGEVSSRSWPFACIRPRQRLLTGLQVSIQVNGHTRNPLETQGKAQEAPRTLKLELFLDDGTWFSFYRMNMRQLA